MLQTDFQFRDFRFHTNNPRLIAIPRHPQHRVDMRRNLLLQFNWDGWGAFHLRVLVLHV